MPSADITKLIEEAVRERLVLRMTYRALDEGEMVSLIEPLAIRFNTAGHRVLWCFNRDAGHLEELLWDRIEEAAGTGEVFPPRPWGAVNSFGRMSPFGQLSHARAPERGLEVWTTAANQPARTGSSNANLSPSRP